MNNEKKEQKSVSNDRFTVNLLLSFSLRKKSFSKKDCMKKAAGLKVSKSFERAGTCRRHTVHALFFPELISCSAHFNGKLKSIQVKLCIGNE
jgi:hypothetical protein